MLVHVSLERKIASERRRKVVHIGAVVCGILAILGLVIFRVSFRESVQRAGAASAPRTRAEIALARRLKIAPTVDIRAGMQQRRELLHRSIMVRFRREDGSELASERLIVRDQPSLIMLEDVHGILRASIDVERIEHILTPLLDGRLRAASSCDIDTVTADNHGVLRAENSCIAKTGESVDSEAASVEIARTLQNGGEEVIVPVRLVEPQVRLMIDGKETTLRRLSTGQSMFKGSGLGRKANVRKAINDHVHSVVIPQDGILSFADAIGESVTTSNGWQMALTIFEGQNLRPAPGGGMCQASTTLYRAALRAGLPILEQRNHSLYVTYYEQYGVGLDATVFPGHQDLKVRNDTPGPIVVQAYTEGDNAYVSLYGIPDDRTVSLDGPYFASTAPTAFAEHRRTLRAADVGWLRHVTRADGHTSTDVLVSRYKSIPRSLVSRIPATMELTMAGASTMMHAAATDGSFALSVVQ